MSHRKGWRIIILIIAAPVVIITNYLLDLRTGQESEAVTPETKQEVVGEDISAQRSAEAIPKRPSSEVPRSMVVGETPQWIKTAAKKRDSSAPSPANILLQDGVGLLEIGQHREARKSFQKLINEHAGSQLLPYAFLAIAESYRLEGGDPLLAQAGTQFQDFLIFFPNHELAPYARERFTELEPVVKAERRRLREKRP